jgi:hypothetical protein
MKKTTLTITQKNPALEMIRQQLLQAAQAFSSTSQPLEKLLSAIVDDVSRAADEPLEIFPVCHHSPASALHLVQRLKAKPPKVIFMEMCEDFRPILESLRECTFPVALQAFALHGEAFPKSWSPLSVVAPLTEFSAEYQAIAYALTYSETELVFVDRSVDHIFQWTPQEEEALDKRIRPEAEADTPEPNEEKKPTASHGAAIGVQVGDLTPTFEAFLEFLLKNARVHNFHEWWEQYIEHAIIGAEYSTYRDVMFLVGSLLRRLGRKEEDNQEDRLRERFMWTRMKQHLSQKQLSPSDAIYICGAIHAASDVEEFGTQTEALWKELPAKTNTKWLYGLIPSSFVAIEHQFRHPNGAISLAEATWKKALVALSLHPFKLEKHKADKPTKKKRASPQTAPDEVEQELEVIGAISAGSEGLLSFLQRPPALQSEDEEQLLRWCIDIVAQARKSGYLTSTADTIAVYQTSKLLANLRNRRHPSSNDFKDAALTCLEKDRTPQKKNIARLCEILLGGDRVGMIGYSSLPPLAQDVYDRLAPLGLHFTNTKTERALIDFKKHPELIPCSDLLWSLSFLHAPVRPIMGERVLGKAPIQESWDVSIGAAQGALIQLAYEGVTVEQIIARRLKIKAFEPEAKAVKVLAATEESLLYLKSPRLTEELGERAVTLLTLETSAKDAPEVFERIRRLVHYYRATPTGIPPWVKSFVTTGYSHYATLLPTCFPDRGTSPEEVGAMLAFLFTLESLALSFGCQRSQLVIAIGQASPLTTDPAKLGLLWASEWLLGLKELDEIRGFLDRVLENELMLQAFPEYVSGFLLALGFTSLVGRLVVELLSKAFVALPDEVMMPWLPTLITTLRKNAQPLLPMLLKEANTCFPASLANFDTWQAPWELTAAQEESAAEEVAEVDALEELQPAEAEAHALLVAAPVSLNEIARLLEIPVVWQKPPVEAPKIAALTTIKKSAAPTQQEPNIIVTNAQTPHPAALMLQEYPVSLMAIVSLLKSYQG